jgi:serine/threonine protein kinase
MSDQELEQRLFRARGRRANVRREAGPRHVHLQPPRRAEAHRAGDKAMSLAAGTRLGPYEIVALLGAGGMEVYRARDTKLGRDVAIKVVPSDVTNDPDAVISRMVCSPISGALCRCTAG